MVIPTTRYSPQLPSTDIPTGLPRSSPETSPYFSHPLHHKDQYSISFRLTPHKSIPGPSLVFGNDFDKPVRDRLPPGFGTAFRIVKWGIDPGLDGDMYADEPYLYGCALSSFNVINVGESTQKGETDQTTPAEQRDAGEAKTPTSNLPKHEEDNDPIILEGGTGSGHLWRQDRDVPSTADARKKWALTPTHQAQWTWEAGREYGFDFFNPYLDFNHFALKLPGFSLNLIGYLGGEDFLRYALKNKDTGEVLFVVVFSLLHKEEVERREKEEEEKKKEVEKKRVDEEKEKNRGEPGVGEAEMGKEKETVGTEPTSDQAGGKGFEPQADDVD